MRRSCPACSQVLYPGEKYGVLQFQCESCRGAWFLAGRLAQLAGQNLPALGVMRRSARLCPDCATLMERAPLGSVEVDWCVTCEGIFLEPGEVAQIRAEADTPDEGDAWLYALRLILIGLG